MQSDIERVWEIELRERMARVEQKSVDSDKALELASLTSNKALDLARSVVSINLVFAIIAMLGSIASVIVVWVTNK